VIIKLKNEEWEVKKRLGWREGDPSNSCNISKQALR
jgi:hypothetical protein